MALNTAGRAAILNSGKAGVTHVGALTDISTTEVAGGSYARQAVTWAAAGTPAAGQSGNTGALTIPIPAGTTVQVLGVYDALSAGNLLGIAPYGSAGQLVDGVATVAVTDIFTSVGHGLTTDDRVFFTTVMGEAIPTGIVTTTLYFVLASGLTADAFKVSTTSAGTALDVTVAGECAFYKTVPNTFASAGNLTVAANAIILDATVL
jgi:hypothetical protein